MIEIFDSIEQDDYDDSCDYDDEAMDVTYNKAWEDGAQYVTDKISNVIDMYEDEPEGWTVKDLVRVMRGVLE